MNDLLKDAAERAARYLESLDERRVFPSAEAIAGLSIFEHDLPEEPTDPAEVLAMLDDHGSPATVASAGGRYFGFVIGSTLPAALAANWLAGVWDQNAGIIIASPIAARLEEIAARWLIDLIGMPATSAVGFVTGATMANFSALAAARHALLARQGWDVETQGLFDAPPISVVVGDEVHASMLKALSMVGFGRERVIRVPVDEQGRMRADSLPKLTESTLLCLQAGNVNSGAFDPLDTIIPAAREAGAWVHVDAAFGLWAVVSPEKASLARGIEQADSIATDAHKWLNVPYDSGLVFCRDGDALRAALSTSAAYLIQTEHREPMQTTPELSRRGRGIEVWAALLSLGRSGLAELIERNCRCAQRMAEGLTTAGYDVLNDVVLNQVVVAFGDDDTTRRIVAAIQAEGTTWAGGTMWHNRAAMRISVSSWATTEADIERSLEAILRIASNETGKETP